MREVLFCISGPSGVGKGTLVRELVKADPTLALSISCTTRSPRKGERDGVDYFFISREEFLRRKAEQDFIECDEHFGSYYGTPKSFVFEKLKEHKSVLLEIDVVGALSVKRTYESEGWNVVLIMIVPPSIEALESRLSRRGSESEEQLTARRTRVNYELSQRDQYDYVVINDKLSDALEEMKRIISEEKNRD